MATSLKLALPVGVVGLGKSGYAAIRVLKLAGIQDKDIITYDDQNSQARCKNAAEFALLGIKTLVVTPGFPLSTPWLVKLQQSGVSLLNEISLASSFLTSEKVIGVTGSYGKSTIVGLIGAVALAQSKNSFIGGNFGEPLCTYVADLLENKRQKAPWIILELSSYHLELLNEKILEFGVITSLTPNHLERYPNKDSYYKTKWTLLKLVKSSVFLNKNGGELMDFSRLHWENKLVVADKNDSSLIPFRLEESVILGDHNQDNLAIAGLVCIASGFDTVEINAIKTYPGLEHRLELLPMKNGVTYINDSKATTIESVKTAILAAKKRVAFKGHLHLLLGGKDKNLPWEELSLFGQDSQIVFYFFGECAVLAKEKSQLKGDTFTTMEEALKEILSTNCKGDVVLLSPGGSSLDQFKNFQERGEVFKSLVASLY